MTIRRADVQPFDFDGIEIRDYTPDARGSSSFAEILVPAGATHARAWSRRSDKYYYVVRGDLRFVVDTKTFDLTTGDVCIVPQGVPFSYENRSNHEGLIILVHTPDFDLEQEVFEE